MLEIFKFIKKTYNIDEQHVSGNPVINESTLAANMLSDGHIDELVQIMDFSGITFFDSQRMFVREVEFQIPLYMFTRQDQIPNIFHMVHDKFYNIVSGIQWSNLLDKSVLNLGQGNDDYDIFIKDLKPIEKWEYLLYISLRFSEVNSYLVESLRTQSEEELFPPDIIPEIIPEVENPFNFEQLQMINDMIEDSKKNV